MPKESRPGGLLDCSHLKLFALERSYQLTYIARLPYVPQLISHYPINSAPIYNQFLDSPTLVINHNELNNLINCNNPDPYVVRCCGQSEVSEYLRVLPAGARCPRSVLSIQVEAGYSKSFWLRLMNEKRGRMNEDDRKMKCVINGPLEPKMIVEIILDVCFVMMCASSVWGVCGVTGEICDENYVLNRCKLFNKEVTLFPNKLRTIRAIARNKRWQVHEDTCTKSLSH